MLFPPEAGWASRERKRPLRGYRYSPQKKTRSTATNFLVTGGAGFIGANLAERLVKRGDGVRILDNFSTGKWENINSFRKDVEVIEGDVRDFQTVLDAMTGIDFCLHHAALTSVTRSIEDPYDTTEVNVRGTLNVLLSAREMKNVKVIYASSASVYGGNPELPRKEDMIPDPLSLYALSKFTGEHYCRLFHRAFNVWVVTLRYFNVFGKMQNAESPYSAVIPKFLKAMLSGTSPMIYGDGNQTRDFTYVGNVVNASLLACERDEADGEVFNIGCGKRTSINKLFAVLGEILQVEITPVYVEERPGDVKHSQADIEKAKRLLGYKPEISLEEGLRELISGEL